MFFSTEERQCCIFCDPNNCWLDSDTVSVFSLNGQTERQWHCLQLKPSIFCQGSPFQIHIDHQCIYATSKRPSIKLLSCECSLRSKILFGKPVQIFLKRTEQRKHWKGLMLELRTYFVSYFTHLFFVMRSPAIWPRILWFVNS